MLYVRYNDVVERPEEQAARIAAFLGGRADAGLMAATVDASLYRNRKGSADHPGEAAAGLSLSYTSDEEGS